MSLHSQGSGPSFETFGRDVSITLQQPIGAMSISPSGRDVVLGSKDGLHIIDLDNPYSPPRYLPHRTSWEVADVQWSPFATRDHWVVSTSNQKALLWNLGASGWRNSIEQVLHGHTRAITDINFSAFNPDMLATCAVDSFVHCWDLRNSTKPAFSFSDWFAGATQVKWSRQDEHIVASSHDKYLYIWDQRKGAYPLRKIEAHDTKIYGIDWNRFEPSKIVTCSLDKTVKFWNTTNPEDVPDRVIETGFPIWRARHTPFGWGLMVMPQRGNSDVHLYDRRSNTFTEGRHVAPIASFPGHKGQVKEFLWRSSGTIQDGVDHRDFQLVTWGTDRELRLHHVSKYVLADVGYEKGSTRTQRLRFTRKGAKYRTFRDEMTDSSSISDIHPRTESFPSNNQYTRFRHRQSTTIGMSRVPMTQVRGWLKNKKSKKTGMHGKAAVRPIADPISWMKNVKIASWDADTLADEVKAVGEKFPRVEFEVLNISQKKLVLSLQSPIGEQNAGVYIRVDMKFPKTYPRQAPATIYVQKTNSVVGEIHKRLNTDVHKIAEAFAKHDRGCVEAVVRFLLREQSLQQIIDWVSRDVLSESKLLDAAAVPDDASDSSDDELIGTAQDSSVPVPNARAPITCAAVWSRTGQLVCLFKVKSQTPESFLSTLGTGHLNASDSDKLFGGFGKFQNDPVARKNKSEETFDANDSDSATSESSSTFSSSVSSSSSGSLPIDPRYKPYKGALLDTLQRTRSAEGSNKSTTQDGRKLVSELPKYEIHIHSSPIEASINKLIAEEYLLQGPCEKACVHNAKVAASAARHLDSAIWGFMGILMKESMPYEVFLSASEHDPMIRELLRSVPLLHRSGNTARLNSHNSTPAKVNSAAGWTKHPLGQSYFVRAVFEYLDRIGDVQLLACLACVLVSSSTRSSCTQPVTKAELDESRVDDPHMISPHELTQRLQSNEARRTFNRAQAAYTGGTQTPAIYVDDLVAPRRRSIGANSTKTPYSSIGFNFESKGSSHAPSVVAEDPSGFISAIHSTIHSTIHSLSTSPETSRMLSRADSTGAFAISKASLHALTKSFSNSPPSQIPNVNPSKPRHGSRSVHIGLSPEQPGFEDSAAKLRSSMSMVDISSRRNDSTLTAHPGKPHVRSILKNSQQGKTANVTRVTLQTRILGKKSQAENLSRIPILLTAETHRRCLGYIYNYVGLLETWCLWSQRAEVLKIMEHAVSQLSDSSKPQVDLEVDSKQGLEIRQCCPRCNNPLEMIPRVEGLPPLPCSSATCRPPHKRPTTRQSCSVCENSVAGLSVPCLQCGHLTCYGCAQEWFASTVITNDTTARVHSYGSSERPSHSSMTAVHSEDHNFSSSSQPHQRLQVSCPTGCGCSCALLQTIEVPAPPEPEPSSTAATERATPTNALAPRLLRHGSHQESSNRSLQESRTQRGQSVHTVDGAVGALMALNASRSRSISGKVTEDGSVGGIERAMTMGSGRGQRNAAAKGEGLSKGSY